jgi:hypothetical protein
MNSVFLEGEMRKHFVAMGVGMLLLAGGAHAAGAEEGTVKAMAPWQGQGYAFPVGPDQAFLVAVYSGVLLVDDGKGPMHAASIVCPASAEGDLAKLTKNAQGYCIITNEDGDRIFARFSCTGDLESCQGPFTLTGGTGKFAGISGEGEMVSRLQARQLTTVTGFESARQVVEGVAVWPKLSYRIP